MKKHYEFVRQVLDNYKENDCSIVILKQGDKYEIGFAADVNGNELTVKDHIDRLEFIKILGSLI